METADPEEFNVLDDSKEMEVLDRQIRQLTVESKKLVVDIEAAEVDLQKLIEENRSFGNDLIEQERILSKNTLELIALNEELFDILADGANRSGSSIDLNLNEMIDSCLKEFLEGIQNPDAVLTVEVKFNQLKVRFDMDKDHMFKNLAFRAANYWSLKVDDIFFANTDEIEDAILYHPEMLILEELYPWKSQRVTFKLPKVYLLLSNFETIEDKLGENSQDQPEVDKKTPISRTNVKKLKEEAQDREKFKKRVKKNNLFYIAQTALFIIVLMLWLIEVVTEKDVIQYNALNQTILHLFTGTSRPFVDIYGTYTTELEQESDFYSVYNEQDVLPWLSSVAYDVYYINYISNTQKQTILGFTVFFPYMQLRQLASTTGTCNYPEFTVNAICAHLLQNGEITQNATVEGIVIPYETGDSRSDGIYEFDTLYSLDGGVLELPTNNYTQFILNSYELAEVYWVNQNSRYMALTINVYNPTISAFTTLVLSFIFDLNTDVIPFFEIWTYYYSGYGPGVIVLNILLYMSALAMIGFAVRDMFTHRTELEYMGEAMILPKEKTVEEMRKYLADWEEHEKLPISKRCNNLDSLSWAVLLFMIGIITVLTVRIIWYNSVLEKDFEVSSTDYVDMVYVSQFYTGIIIAQGMVTLLIISGILKYSMLWIKSMALIASMIVVKVKKFSGFMFASTLGLIGFTTYFYFAIGPYEFRASIDYLTIQGMCRFFVGRWFASVVFNDFISVWYVIIPIFTFLYFRMTIVNMSIINLQWQYMKVTEDVMNRSPASVPQEKQVS